jgi:hypothetical protein
MTISEAGTPRTKGGLHSRGDFRKTAAKRAALKARRKQVLRLRAGGNQPDCSLTHCSASGLTCGINFGFELHFIMPVHLGQLLA